MSFQVFFTIFLLPTFVLLLLIKPKRKQEISRKLPPGPKKLPIIGNLHQLGDLPHRSLQSLADEHGPLMFLQLGSIPTLVVSSADAAGEIFKSHDLAFSNRPVLYAAKRFSYNCSSMSFAPYGEYWREVRKIATVELLSAKKVQSFKGIREQEVASLVESIVTSASPLVNLSELTLSLANNVTRRVAFGDPRGDAGKSKFHEILGETQNLLGGFCLSDFFPGMEWINKFNGLEAKLERNFNELDRYYDRVLEEHRGGPIANQVDLVNVLLRLQKDPNQAIPIGNEHVKGVLTDIFIAGTETSAATMVWVMTELMKNPSEKKRVQEEIRGVAKGKPRVEESDLQELTYLTMVIKEGLRLHPPVPLLLPRETTGSCMVGGYEIPAKTRVFLNALAINSDPKYWEDPNDFRPERFSGSSVDFRGLNYEFIPFGAGRRSCPGINFSGPLIELALANLLHRFDWTLPEGMRGESLDVEEACGLTVHKKNPLWLAAYVQ